MGGNSLSRLNFNGRGQWYGFVNVIAVIQQEFFASSKARGHSDEKIAEVCGLMIDESQS
jgi:hypothetical protein